MNYSLMNNVYAMLSNTGEFRVGTSRLKRVRMDRSSDQWEVQFVTTKPLKRSQTQAIGRMQNYYLNKRGVKIKVAVTNKLMPGKIVYIINNRLTKAKLIAY